MGRIWVHLCALLCQYLEPNMLGTLTTFKNCNSLFKKSEIIFTNDIQHLYDFSHKLVSLKQMDLEIASFIVKAQSIAEELQMF